MSLTTNTLTQIILEAEKKFGHLIEIGREHLLSMEEFKDRAKKANYIVRTGEPGPWNSVIIRYDCWPDWVSTQSFQERSDSGIKVQRVSTKE